jgi:hypothetical protein
MNIKCGFNSFLLFVIGLEGCNPICTNLDPVYNFSITASIVPSKDSINVGDTVYLISSFPSTLQDQYGKLINYADAKNINSSMGFNDLSAIGNKDSSTIKNFFYENFEGQIFNSTSVPLPWHGNQLFYEEVNDEYRLEIAFIPKASGTYCLLISDAYCAGLNHNKACKQASFAIALTNTDQHLYYYENLFGVGVLSKHDYGRTYCFKVVK